MRKTQNGNGPDAGQMLGRRSFSDGLFHDRPVPDDSAETPNDARAIERLHERTFGPGRFVLSAYRLREDVGHLYDLSFTAWIGTLLLVSCASFRSGSASIRRCCLAP